LYQLCTLFLVGFVTVGFYLIGRGILPQSGGSTRDHQVGGTEGVVLKVDQASARGSVWRPQLPSREDTHVESADDKPAPDRARSKPASPERLAQHAATILAAADKPAREAAVALLEAAATGNASKAAGLDRDAVKSLAKVVGEQVPSEDIADYLEDAFRIPREITLSRENPSQTILDLFDAVAGNPTQSAEASALVMTDACTSDGSVTGNVHVIPAGSRKVYAVFENDRALQGLGHVLAVWRDPSDNDRVFTEMEVIRTGSTHNYVWLELDDGWPAGSYRVDLFHPEQQSQLLASESFNVR
jgi:hypothetical protein